MKYKYQSGITLIDLLVTISILAILIGVSAPGMQDYLAKSESRGTISLVRRTVDFARNYAVKNKLEVTVCNVAPDCQCQKNSISNLTLFNDANKNRCLDDDEDIVHISQFDTRGDLYLSASFGKSYLVFTPEGYSQQAGSFIFCLPQFTQFAGRVTISTTGRSYIGRDTNSDGVVEKVNGQAILC